MKFKYHLVFLLIIIFLVAFLSTFLYSLFTGKKILVFGEDFCGDGTLYEKCSADRPYYCSDGLLYERASLCGCPLGFNQTGEKCLSPYQTNSKELSLEYTLRGKERNMDIVVYEGAVEYLSEIPRAIEHDGNGNGPSRLDFKLKNINDEQQRQLLLPLVKEIQSNIEDETDQARTAISIVQSLEWGRSNKSLSFGGINLEYSRYPYEVLYDEQGICGEKTDLLIFLLRELGYGVAFFYNQQENHESVGIRCPVSQSWYDSGYCFIETSGPSVMTDTGIEYVGGQRLNSKPEIFIISEGKALDESLYEYQDAEDLMRIRSDISYNGGTLNPLKTFKYSNLVEKYGLIDEYRIE